MRVFELHPVRKTYLSVTHGGGGYQGEWVARGKAVRRDGEGDRGGEGESVAREEKGLNTTEVLCTWAVSGLCYDVTIYMTS